MTLPPRAETRLCGRFASSAVSHQGAVRTRNEDSYVCCPERGLWAVADGVGGHQAGDVAARMVTEALAAVPSGLDAAQVLAEVQRRLENAHHSLREAAAERGPDAVMATTVVVLLIRGDHYACLWAGDSRAYLWRDGQIAQLTHDHSLVQELVDSAAITSAEADAHPRANVITRALGAGARVPAIDRVSDRLQNGDRFLLCSDGLWKALPLDDIARLMGEADAPAQALLAAALDRHADDNVTAVTVEIDPEMVSFAEA